MSERTLGGGDGYGRHWRDIADEMEFDGRMTQVSDRLCAAESADQSIHAVMARASRQFKHSILFRVRGGIASVWEARGWAGRETLPATFAASAVSGNPLELLVVHPSYRGATPLEQAYVPFFQQLGLPFPQEISLTPVEVGGRVVAIFYGDNGEESPLEGEERCDLALARSLSLGLTLVLIKNKIRGIADG